MLHIERGTTNRISLTVEEMAICNEPRVYNFIVRSENSDRIQATAIIEPINTGFRLQMFEVVEGLFFSLPIDGYYTYEVRQTTSGNVCEVGLLRVGNPPTPVIHDNTNTPLVYGN